VYILIKYFRYLWYILKHKWYVLIECIKLKIPFRGLVHDLSKFLPCEFNAYMKFFYSNMENDNVKLEFDLAWNHHQNVNKHHWQYWLLRLDDGSTECLPIPKKYLKEMLADWIGAGKAITGENNIKSWYMKNKDKMNMCPESIKYLEEKIDNM